MHLLMMVALQLAQLPTGLEAAAPSVQRGATLYVPLTSGGLAVFDASVEGAPKLVGTVLEGRFITRLMLDGDRLVALETREEALVLSTERKRPLGSALDPSPRFLLCSSSPFQ
jgi:hypothetical protein